MWNLLAKLSSRLHRKTKNIRLKNPLFTQIRFLIILVVIPFRISTEDRIKQDALGSSGKPWGAKLYQLLFPNEINIQVF